MEFITGKLSLSKWRWHWDRSKHKSYLTGQKQKAGECILGRGRGVITMGKDMAQTRGQWKSVTALQVTSTQPDSMEWWACPKCEHNHRLHWYLTSRTREGIAPLDPVQVRLQLEPRHHYPRLTQCMGSREMGLGALHVKITGFCWVLTTALLSYPLLLGAPTFSFEDLSWWNRWQGFSLPLWPGTDATMVYTTPVP